MGEGVENLTCMAIDGADKSCRHACVVQQRCHRVAIIMHDSSSVTTCMRCLNGTGAHCSGVIHASHTDHALHRCASAVVSDKLSMSISCVIVMTHIPDMRRLPTRLVAATNHTAVNNHNMSAPASCVCCRRLDGSFCRSVCSSFPTSSTGRRTHQHILRGRRL